MKTRFYKTFDGFLRVMKDEQITVQSFLNKRVYKRGIGSFNFELSEKAINEVCKIISESIYSTRKAQKEAFVAMIENCGDNSFFQCFYINYQKGKIYINNSLSGEAYNYCKRMFLKSTR